MCLPQETTTFGMELLCQAYRQDRLRLAEQERLLRLAQPRQKWSKQFSCAACKLLYYRLISPLYHYLKRRIETSAA